MHAGLFSLSDVQSMVCEVNKMQDFDHPHVMSLIGVCLDAGHGIATDKVTKGKNTYDNVTTMTAFRDTNQSRIIMLQQCCFF